MSDLKTQILEHGPKEIKDPSLHFRRECGDYTCGAHKSWDEGFQAAVELLWPVVEACDSIDTGYFHNYPFAKRSEQALSDLQSKLGSEK